jgi:hypothetical protein
MIRDNQFDRREELTLERVVENAETFTYEGSRPDAETRCYALLFASACNTYVHRSATETLGTSVT